MFFGEKKQDVIKCGIYIRVSSSHQANDGFGLKMQQDRCENIAIVKNWEVVKVYADEGISGTVIPAKRDGLRELLTDATTKKIGGVIFYSLDRLGRAIRIVLDVVDYLECCGTKMVSCRENIDTSKPIGQFAISILSAIAELERKNIATRLQEGKKERIKKDGEIGGGLPYGYCRINKRVSINEREAEVIRRIFEERDKNIRQNDIKIGLNGDNIWFDFPNKEWGNMNIHRVLSRKDIYLGDTRNGSETCWPKILDDKYKDKNFVKTYKKKDRKEINIKQKAKERGVNIESLGV